jgi:hypothetical protein
MRTIPSMIARAGAAVDAAPAAGCTQPAGPSSPVRSAPTREPGHRCRSPRPVTAAGHRGRSPRPVTAAGQRGHLPEGVVRLSDSTSESPFYEREPFLRARALSVVVLPFSIRYTSAFLHTVHIRHQNGLSSEPLLEALLRAPALSRSEAAPRRWSIAPPSPSRSLVQWSAAEPERVQLPVGRIVVGVRRFVAFGVWMGRRPCAHVRESRGRRAPAPRDGRRRGSRARTCVRDVDSRRARPPLPARRPSADWRAPRERAHTR